MQRFRIDWTTPAGKLTAIEPTLAEVASHAPALAAAYNDPHNAPLMGHAEAMSTDDVIEHYRDLIDDGDRPFLLFADNLLAGDADLRGIDGGAAEFAFLIAARAAQGKGLGTRFAIMVHSFGFRELQLATIYAAVVPANVASRRVFEKLGHVVDRSPAARNFADEDDDVVLAMSRSQFEARQPAAATDIVISARTE